MRDERDKFFEKYEDFVKDYCERYDPSLITTTEEWCERTKKSGKPPQIGDFLVNNGNPEQMAMLFLAWLKWQEMQP